MRPVIIVAAFFSFSLAAQQNDDIFGGDDVDAVIAKAEAGDAEAQMALAQRYRFGVGVALNPAKAVEWFQKAAEQGHVQGQFSVGFMYQTGENGIEKNLEKAAEWYRKAAENGHLNALANLGSMYQFGLGVERNEAQAAELYKTAAENGAPLAQFYMARMYIRGDGAAKDIKKAIELLQEAAEQGLSAAYIELAQIYAGVGNHIKKNMVAAADLYLKAAELGDDIGQYYIGLMYYDGRGVKKNRAEAIRWLQKAADQNNFSAQERLGNMYLKGDGVKKNEIEGLAWLYLADSNAPINTASFYYIAELEKKFDAEKTYAARRRSAELKRAINLEISAKRGLPAPESAGNPISIGTGVVISSDGLILVPASIVAGAESVKIKTSLYESPLPAEVLEINAGNNLAVLKCEGSFTPLPVVSAEHIRVDQRLYAILSPRSAENYEGPGYSTATVHKLTGAKKNPEFLQITGNSSLSAKVVINYSPLQLMEDITGRTQTIKNMARDVQTILSGFFLNNIGGPVLDESTNLVGMILFRNVSDEGFVYVLKAEALRSLLGKYGVDVVKKPENADGNAAGQKTATQPRLLVPNRNSVVMVLSY